MDKAHVMSASEKELVMKCEGATDCNAEGMEHRPDPIENLYRLADECAGVIAELSSEGACFQLDDVHSYVEDGFARMVRARVAARQKAEVKLDERWPTESEDDYVSRVARDEAGGWLQELRGLIAATLGKHGSLTEEQLKLIPLSW